MEAYGAGQQQRNRKKNKIQYSFRSLLIHEHQNWDSSNLECNTVIGWAISYVWKEHNALA
jgi:hypothetical protein